jgi:hypothetical protein
MPEESHKEQDERRRRERQARQDATGGVARERIWPAWMRTLGAMIEADAIVRFVCTKCKRVYDVDVGALALLRGREWSLIGRKARCKASTCRRSGFFVAASGMDQPFVNLGGGETPKWLIGARPREHEAPDNDPDDDRPPPAPKGVDAVRWAWANDSERRRMVKRARG